MLCSPSSGSVPRTERSSTIDIEDRAGRAVGLDVLRHHGCGLVQSESDDRSVKVAAELRNVRIVGIQHSDAAGRQRLDELILRARNSRNRIEELQVYRCDHGHDTAIRLGQRRQVAYLAGVRHAHLDHRQLVLGLELEQLQRHAELVVEIALRLQNAMAGRENVRDDFLRRGLAGGSGHADQRLRPQPAHCRSQPLKCASACPRRRAGAICIAEAPEPGPAARPPPTAPA